MQTFATTDRLAVITGGASGIGRAVVDAWLAGGGRVIVIDRDQAGLDALLAHTGTERVRGIVADLTDGVAVHSAFDDIRSTESRLEALINCAGFAIPGVTADSTDEQWEAMWSVNLMGTFRTCREAYDLLRATDGAAIVNISSAVATHGVIERTGYTATKGGVDAVTRALAVEWAGDGIRCNAVAPGYVLTPQNRALVASGALDEAATLNRIPMRRLALPTDIAQAVVFLALDTAAYITGQILAVDGGFAVNGSAVG